MPKIKVWCDSGANIDSERSEIVDTESDWSIDDEEWADMTERARHACVMDWAWNYLDIGYKELS